MYVFPYYKLELIFKLYVQQPWIWIDFLNVNFIIINHGWVHKTLRNTPKSRLDKFYILCTFYPYLIVISDWALIRPNYFWFLCFSSDQVFNRTLFAYRLSLAICNVYLCYAVLLQLRTPTLLFRPHGFYFDFHKYIHYTIYFVNLVGFILLYVRKVFIQFSPWQIVSLSIILTLWLLLLSL